MNGQIQYNYFLLCFFLLCSVYISAQQPIILTPKWTAQAQFTGYYAAEQKGFYKDEGLNVRIEHPAISESSFSVLQKGLSQVAVMNLSFALTARANGAKIVNVMQTSQQNSLMLVCRTPIKSISELQKKKIAVWNHLSEELLERLATYYKLNIEWIRFNSGINVFISKAVDICLVGSYNEYLQLIECGLKADSLFLFKFTEMGYNLPEDGLYVTEDYYAQNPDIVQRIVRASIKGWQWTKEHPEEALEIVMSKIKENNIGTNRYHQQKMLEELFRLQIDSTTGKAIFRLSHDGFDTAAKILLDEKKQHAIQYEDFVK